MPRKSRGEYPPNWEEIATQVKDDAGWQCVRCGHIHQPKEGYCLTVHHLDGDKSNNNFWNIPALCQRCHLRIQAKVNMDQGWFFEHSSWFLPYVAGYYAFKHDLPHDREYVESHIEKLLDLGKPNGLKKLGSLNDEQNSSNV